MGSTTMQAVKALYEDPPTAADERKLKQYMDATRATARATKALSSHGSRADALSQ